MNDTIDNGKTSQGLEVGAETAGNNDVINTTDSQENAHAPSDGQVVALEEKLSTTHERLLRTAADLDNLRKRSKRDVEDALARGRSDVLLEILPVLDSIDLALAAKGSDGADGSIIEGVQMIKKQFLTATERFGLREVESKGCAFDPNFHEAVAHIASAEHPAGQIVDEMRKGYMLGDKLLRAAMVVVSKGEDTPANGAESGGQGSDEANDANGTPRSQKVDNTM